MRHVIHDAIGSGFLMICQDPHKHWLSGVYADLEIFKFSLALQG